MKVTDKRHPRVAEPPSVYTVPHDLVVRQAEAPVPEPEPEPIEPLTVMPFGAEVLPATALPSLKARRFMVADLVIEPPMPPESGIEIRVHNAAAGAYGYLSDVYGAENVATVALTAKQALAETGSQSIYPDCSYLAYLVHIATEAATTPAANDIAA